ncbi:MAG: OadG family protein [Firmicutes bacterium]|nr:OadG family protein [Bacillota bacterium]
MGITEVSVVEAVLIAISGILVVFMMLAILSVVITAISRFSTEKPKSTPAAAEVSEAPAAAAVQDVPYGGTVKLLNVDEKTAACVMAIVSHETQIPLNQLVFKSIKAVNE